jgi:TRAP-type C4-dicarboxylate transport system substrate-binding protein
MKKLFVLCLTVVVALASIFLFSQVQAQEKVLKLRYSNFNPPMAPMSKVVDAWCEEIAKRTQGRVQVRHYAGATLTPPMQTYDSVVKGVADIGQALLAYAPGRLPLSEVLYLPLGARTASQAINLSNAYYKKFRPKEFDDVKVMYFLATDPCLFSTKLAVSSVDDLKGQRIKVNTEVIEIAKGLGIIPLTMPVTETYDALRQGMIDGLLMATEGMKAFRFGELVKTTLENYAASYCASIFIIMNKKKWNSISKADQKAIGQINEEWIEKSGRKWDELTVESKAWTLEKGVKWITATPEEEARTREKMRPAYDRYLSEMKAKGLPGEEALKFCQDYLKAHP